MHKTQKELSEILEQLLKNPENEYIEFKEAKNNFEIDKLGKYFSAISNEATLKEKQYGWIIFGINDRTHSVVGTNFQNNNNFNKIKKQISENTTDNISFIEIYSFLYDGKRVIMFQVPAAFGTTIKWKKIAYGRNGESLTLLSDNKTEQIKIVSTFDWTRKIIENATINDLDKEAINIARDQFKIKNSGKEIFDEIDDLSDEEFLNKAKVTINGKITRAAMILLGKNECDYLLENFCPKITWKLFGNNNIEDYEHFGIPFIINARKVREKIRNLRCRYMIAENTLFPLEVDKYDNFTLRELINNCIVHQDYRINAPISIIEYADRLIFSNQGTFIPKTIEKVLKNDFSSPYYRNPFLANAMVNLNMIDTVGSGIKRIFNNQKEKFFPMPDYDLSEKNTVRVVLYGKIIDERYSRILFEKPELPIEKVVLLDMVQKNKLITKEQCDCLKKDNLIEGRFPKIYISSDIAKIVDDKVTYMERKGLDNKFYIDYIIEYLTKFEKATRKDINSLIYPRLPLYLNIYEKNCRVKYLLTKMRKNKLIINIGSDTKPIWILNKK